MLNSGVVFCLTIPGATQSPTLADLACCRSPGGSLHTQRGELLIEIYGIFVSMQPVVLAHNKILAQKWLFQGSIFYKWALRCPITFNIQ